MCTKLYLCDGKACEESLKRCCFTQGFECHHTSNIEHSLSHTIKNFPKTTFYNDGFGSEIEKIEMSKQRPYGTFEEAYMIRMLTYIPEILDDFIFTVIRLYNEFDILSELPEFRAIHLPSRFYDEPLICEYWNGLCGMYGNIFYMDRFNHILVENFDLCTEHLVNLIKNCFPPGWNIIRDEPILSLCDISFV